jgi:hypothetical protein
LPSAAPNPPAHMKSRWKSIITSAVRASGSDSA